VQTALAKAQTAASSAVSTYKKIAAVTPKDPNVQLELAEAARTAGDTAAAIAAYEKYLTLVPADDPTTRDVKRLINELKPGAAG
jgi:cytochrome c-type biogenesis protein CcmH/NrfG